MGIVAAIILFSFVWGLSNRGRGYGPRAGAPAWQVWAANHLLHRDSMAGVHGLSVYLFTRYLGEGLWPSLILAVVVAVTWRVAVSPGWGEYQDGKRINNNERPWIDAFMNKLLLPGMVKLAEWMLWGPSARLARNAPAVYSLTENPRFVDGVSMGLRGGWYLPIYIVTGFYLGSWWMLLPAVFFWQSGMVYAVLWKVRGGDVVFHAEWIDDSLRGLLFSSALALAIL